jgi:hypothetical protein
MRNSYRTAAALALVCLMAAGISTSAWAEADGLHSPTPLVDDVSPTVARLGGGGFLLTLKGAGFRRGAEIGWHVGSTTRRLPAFVCSPSEIVTWISDGLVARAATATVTVMNPDAPPLVGESNPVLLPITLPTPGLAFTEKKITMGVVLDGLVSADFNGDGKADLAVSEPFGNDGLFNNGNVAILLGKGDGTFTAAPTPAVHRYAGELVVGDFNGDGKPDIAVLSYEYATVDILLGTGDGTFSAAPVSPYVGGEPDAIVVGDLNGDGKLDLVIGSGINAGMGYSTMSVLLGNGDGSFSAIAPLTLESQPVKLFLADLNRDGKLDLVIGNGTSPWVSILLGRGNGTFSAQASAAATVSPLAVMDVNRDGKLDLIFSQGDDPGDSQTSLSVLLGEGNGEFTPGPPSPVIDDHTTWDLLADLNGDGKLDYVESGGYPNQAYKFVLGDGHGRFNETSSFDPSNNNGSGPLVAADFNGDGRLDLATRNGLTSGIVSVLLQVPAP